MRTIVVAVGQNLNDIALQEYGSTDGMLQLALDNGLGSVGQNLTAGQLLKIDDSKVIDPETRDFMKAQANYKVATNDEYDAALVSGGIGYMIINETFIVNAP